MANPLLYASVAYRIASSMVVWHVPCSYQLPNSGHWLPYLGCHGVAASRVVVSIGHTMGLYPVHSQSAFRVILGYVLSELKGLLMIQFDYNGLTALMCLLGRSLFHWSRQGKPCGAVFFKSSCNVPQEMRSSPPRSPNKYV